YFISLHGYHSSPLHHQPFCRNLAAHYPVYTACIVFFTFYSLHSPHRIFRVAISYSHHYIIDVAFSNYGAYISGCCFTARGGAVVYGDHDREPVFKCRYVSAVIPLPERLTGGAGFKQATAGRYRVLVQRAVG